MSFHLSSKINDIYLKIEKILLLHEQLKTNYSKLTSENNELKNKISEQTNLINQLEDKNKILQLAKTITKNEPEQTGQNLKPRINELIREIDKCVALLNS